ncbi:hypothetical protein D3C83_32180 [compost metagenome]
MSPERLAEIALQVAREAGQLAHPGDRILIGGYEATVEDVRRRRIWRVAIRPYQPSLRPTPKPSVDPD